MQTRYPILLVHGLGIKDTFFLKSFGLIDKRLRAQGYTVYKSKIDAFGSVQSNAAQLKDEIFSILHETGAEKINIIAHSKGGLDAKCMIEQYGISPHIASLTTLCTPHGGSPIASFILRFPRLAVKYLAFWVNLIYRVLGDQSPDSFAACEDLQRGINARQQTISDSDGIMYQSFSATMRPGLIPTDFAMYFPLILSRTIEKEMPSDGLVPRDSAVFGHFRGDCVDDSISHTEIIDFMLCKKKKEKVYSFYTALCEELAREGL